MRVFPTHGRNGRTSQNIYVDHVTELSTHGRIFENPPSVGMESTCSEIWKHCIATRCDDNCEEELILMSIVQTLHQMRVFRLVSG